LISTGDLKRGLTIELDGQLWTVVEFQHIKMGRGSAQVRLKLKNLKTGYNVEKTFQAGEKFQRAVLDHQNVQYLYRDGDHYYFMDTTTFEQLTLSSEQLGDSLNYIKEGNTLDLLSYEGEPIGVELPTGVELEVVETEPGFRGDTAVSGTKPATLETGLVVQVPLFVDTGDKIKVDTRTGEYIERV